jgi:hypothetical protein
LSIAFPQSLPKYIDFAELKTRTGVEAIKLDPDNFSPGMEEVMC